MSRNNQRGFGAVSAVIGIAIASIFVMGSTKFFADSLRSVNKMRGQQRSDLVRQYLRNVVDCGATLQGYTDDATVERITAYRKDGEVLAEKNQDVALGVYKVRAYREGRIIGFRVRHTKGQHWHDPFRGIPISCQPKVYSCEEVYPEYACIHAIHGGNAGAANAMNGNWSPTYQMECEVSFNLTEYLPASKLSSADTLELEYWPGSTQVGSSMPDNYLGQWDPSTYASAPGWLTAYGFRTVDFTTDHNASYGAAYPQNGTGVNYNPTSYDIKIRNAQNGGGQCRFTNAGCAAYLGGLKIKVCGY